MWPAILYDDVQRIYTLGQHRLQRHIYIPVSFFLQAEINEGTVFFFFFHLNEGTVYLILFR